jgi:hypothetical protein
MTYVRNLLLPLLITGLFIGCDSTDPIDTEPLEATLVEDIPADPVTRDPGDEGPGATTGRYTFFSLRENEVIPSADSASTKWDIAFNATTIRVNNGVSGPGEGGVQVVQGLIEEVTEAPADGYDVDSEDGLAIPAGSGNGWYNYSGPPNHLITPIPGRVLVVRTADGRYAKVRLLSYYKGNPSQLPADSEAHPDRHYTFEYVFQPDGSRVLE